MRIIVSPPTNADALPRAVLSGALIPVIVPAVALPPFWLNVIFPSEESTPPEVRGLSPVAFTVL